MKRTHLAGGVVVHVVWKYMDLIKFKAKFEPIFDVYLGKKLEEMRKRLDDPFLYEIVSQAARIAKKGGKRARPFLVYAMYRVCGGKNEEVGMRVAMGIELFHIFCLIHDDITDRGKVRHGEQTIHEYALLRMKKEKRRGDLAHVAESQAMLAGDLVYAWAYERIAGLRGIAPDVHQDALSVFIEAMQDVVAGQMIDIDLTTQKSASLARIIKKMELKTASYTFVRPLELGAVLAGASSQVRAFCHDFGMAVGVAFQLQDDMLDIVGTQEELGKKPMGDIREGQHTPLSCDAFAHASSHDKKIFTQVFGRGALSSHEAKEIRRIFQDTGAIASAQKRVAQGFAKGRALLQEGDLSHKGKKIFSELLARIERRTA